MFHGMEQTPTERTAEAVRVALARHRVKASQLADIIGCSRTTMWRRLNGEHPFDVAELSAIAQHLGIPASTFLIDDRAA